MQGLDRESYNVYFDNIIPTVVADYSKKYSELIFDKNAKAKIWNCYCEFNQNCKNHYMKNSEKLLDRHKVSSAYIYAILKVSPLICVTALEEGVNDSLLLNEKLALCFGMTLLRSLIFAEINNLSDECLNLLNVTKKDLENIFDDGVLFPEVNHGNYKHNLLVQLYHTKKESSYNILALSETLYLLETFTLVKNGLPENLFCGNIKAITANYDKQTYKK